jgi:hypothetical protein
MYNLWGYIPYGADRATSGQAREKDFTDILVIARRIEQLEVVCVHSLISRKCVVPQKRRDILRTG